MPPDTTSCEESIDFIDVSDGLQSLDERHKKLPSNSPSKIKTAVAASREEKYLENLRTESSALTHFDDILELAGGSGKWQLLIVTWLSTFYYSLPFMFLSLVFLGATPDFRCAEDHPENVTFHEIPESASQCYRSSGAPCQQWRYNTDTDGDAVDDFVTLVSRWNLVCSRRPMLSALQSALMAGGMLGSQVAGLLSDRMGRRRVYLLMNFFFVAAPLLSTVVDSYEIYFVLKFILGFGWVGTTNTGFVLAVELVGRKWRAAASQLMMLPIALGLMIMAALAYNLRIWWQLQLALACPYLVYAANVWLIPESPRWLILRHRDEEAIDVLKSVARVNGKQLPARQQLRLLMDNVRRGETVEQSSKQPEENEGLRMFWRSDKLRRWTAITGVFWFAIGISYYGLQFDVSLLSDSPYLACALLGVAEVPSFFSSPLLNTFGRRRTLATMLLLAGIALLLFTVKRDPKFWLVLGLFGKFFVGTAYSISFIYTPEYIPTSVRTFGLGFGSVSCHIGAMLAPFVVDLLREIDQTLPSVVLGCLCFVAGTLVRFLPETVGRCLPDTVADLDAGVLDISAGRVNRGKEVQEGMISETNDESEDRGVRLKMRVLNE